MANGAIIPWAIFNALVLALLVGDLLIFHRQPRAMRMREALGWSGFWIALALGFNLLVHPMYDRGWFGFGREGGEVTLPGSEAALQFMTGYLIELSLSVDNLFVFLAVFQFFGLRGEHQHRVLFWGIVGAIVLRAVMILTGIALIARFGWLLYPLGGFLIFTGIRLAMEKGDERIDPEHSWVIRVARRHLPIAKGDHQGRFTLREDGRLRVTTLFLVLLVVESTDVVFALDSIPAILAITQDPFIAYTSNIFAVLGLRAMYFALAGLLGLFRYLRYGLVGVLVFIGGKMVAPLFGLGHVPVRVSLIVVASLLGASVVASLVAMKRSRAAGGVERTP